MEIDKGRRKEEHFESRADNIDILKSICAFFIVCIHIPFPGEGGNYFTVLTRIAVPITGYFYLDTLKRQREKKQIYNGSVVKTKI
ncbi:hypothetical protein [Anaerostipes sp. MSJ-23]|uniref:hypothetical protein n=1 Tax=Anaerostipes sp. MSJ-23 TaxID=2841520 RepID=UPI001C104115|nr:hypothetical protein [Anaerostipes sp. MSJ-23]MBU5459675.1 hypothetical protein [Anaerostipes sp. MSJ-23]